MVGFLLFSFKIIGVKLGVVVDNIFLLVLELFVKISLF